MRLIVTIVVVLTILAFLDGVPSPATRLWQQSYAYVAADDDGGADDGDQGEERDDGDDDDGDDDDHGTDRDSERDDDNDDDFSVIGSHLLMFGPPVVGAAGSGMPVQVGAGFGNAAARPRGRRRPAVPGNLVQKKPIAAGQLPDRVVKAIQRAYPGAAVREAAEYARPGKQPLFYGALLAVNGKTVHVTVSPRGVILRRERRG